MNTKDNIPVIQEFTALATTTGVVLIEINGALIAIAPKTRHLILDQIRTAVQMADLADPDNDQLNKALR